MKKITIIIAVSLVLSPTINHTAPIKLESSILTQIDGLLIGINGETIALIKQYQSQIMNMLLGTRTANGRVGVYDFDGQKCNVQQLRQLEIEQGTNDRFIAFRKRIQTDFEHFSEPFKKIVQGVRAIMAILIEESCKKRNRLNSLLYIWAKTDEKDFELFDLHVKSIKDFEIFLTDLNNFLGDLAHSCPRAQIQFQEQVAKFNRAKQFVMELDLSNTQRQLFLRYLNTQLANLPKDEITKEKIIELSNSFSATLPKD